ncbi:MAG: phosphodiester glycosidase family protein [Anaerolineales bacterium]
MQHYRMIFLSLAGGSLLALVWMFAGAGSIARGQETPPPDFPTATASLAPFPTSTLDTPALNMPRGAALPGIIPPERRVHMTCHAEAKWTYLINVRRGPSSNWGIIRQLLHREENPEMRVFGRDADREWFHVVLPAPYLNEVGWVWSENVNIFGRCADLPITAETPEISLDQVPPAPAMAPMPGWVPADIRLTRYDRAFPLNDAMLYIRRQIPGDERERMQVHLLLMNLQDERVRVGTTIGAIPGVRAIPVSGMAEAVGAYAAITGDYYAGNYWPQGITVIDGAVVTAPKFRSAFGLTHDREPFIGYFTTSWTWPASVTAENGEVIPLQLMNLPCQVDWLCLYSHHRANRLPLSYRGLRVLLDEDFTVLEIVDNEGLDIPDGHFALRGEGSTADWLRANVEIGDTLQIDLPTEPPWQDFESAISGGPRLLMNGEFFVDCDPTAENPICEEFTDDFRARQAGASSLPRVAVAYDDSATLLYAAMVEGYEVEDSGGATRRELADFLLEFGASEAMEFDGGGSATMYLAGNSVSDHGWEGERPGTNALVFYWDE